MFPTSRNPRRLSTAILLFAVCITVPAAARTFPVTGIGGKDYVSLHELTVTGEIKGSFDMVLQRGSLSRESHRAIYAVGLSAFIIDGRLYTTAVPVTRRGGEVMLPADAAREILRALYPGQILTREGDRLVLVPRSDDRKDKRDLTPPDAFSRDAIGFIVVDPGHGGKDPGAVGKGGVMEKNVTLAVAKHLVAELRKSHPGITVHLTRTNDSFIELLQRTVVANRLLKKKVNGLFISVHVNASIADRISGYETYYLSQNPSNEEARTTAALENNVVILEEKGRRDRAYGDIAAIEALMMTTQIQKESNLLADAVQAGMGRAVSQAKSRGVRKADFFVLRGVLMPAALVEIGFITNRKEARVLTDSAHQKEIAAGIARGVGQFITRYNAMIRK